jgi:polyisoprenoid-binding protein YceI
MINLLRLIYKHGNRISVGYLVSLWLLFAQPASAMDLQCNLAESSHINPSILNTMLAAAHKGYLYRVDTSISNVAFQVNHFPFSSVKGHFKDFDGGLALPVEADQSRQVLFFIKVDSMATGDHEMDDYLKSTVFFDATRFPDIIFVSTGFEWIDDTTARLHGELTLRGTTRPLAFNVHINTTDSYTSDQSQKITLSANAEIRRSQFGMHKLPLLVSDTVRLNFKIEASRVGSQI